MMCKKHRTATMTSVKKSLGASRLRVVSSRRTGKTSFIALSFASITKSTGACVSTTRFDASTPAACTKYEFVVESETGTGAAAARKVCVAHAPPGYEIALKRMCKYCDIREDVPLVCVSCRQRMHKKEHAVVRHLRRTIDAPFIYDESPGFECTRKRPDIRFETAFVRYNPDAVRYGGTVHSVTAAERIDLLVETVKSELVRVSLRFEVRLIQLWYDAPLAEAKREMDITMLVAV